MNHMKKQRFPVIVWVIVSISAMVCVTYYLETHSSKSLPLASGFVSLFLLMKIHEARAMKRTSIGINRVVAKSKDPKAFKAHLVWYSILLSIALVIFVRSVIVLISGR